MMNLVVKDFKYSNLKKTIFYILKYEKKLSNLLLSTNSKTLIFFLMQSNDFRFNSFSSSAFKFFLFSDLVHIPLQSNSISTFEGAMNRLMNVHLFFFIHFLLNKKKHLSVVSLPNKKEIFTLLRSPHTDKKSREQFRKLQYRKLLHGISFFSYSLIRFLTKKEHITSKIRSKYVGK